MNENYVFENFKHCKINVPIPRSTIDFRSNRIRHDDFFDYLRDNLSYPDWAKPGTSMPFKVEITAYIPIPKGKPNWFKQAATKGLIPCVTEYSADVQKAVISALIHNEILTNSVQVFSVSCDMAYSVRPRLIVEVYGFYQNVGALKRECKKEEL